MFAVVRIIEREKSLFRPFRKAEIFYERVILPNGESFFIISAVKAGDRVPFKEILSFSGKLCNSLIFESGFDFHSYPYYTPWYPIKLRKKLLLSLALNHLSYMKLNPIETAICLFDNDGLYLDEVDKLLNYASKIHIICRDTDIYHEKIYSLLCQYGASVTVNEKLEGSDRFNVVISHSSSEIPLSFKGIIFTNEKRPFLNGRCFSVNSAELSFEYEKLRPDGVDKLIFASALYEKCNVSEKEMKLILY